MSWLSDNDFHGIDLRRAYLRCAKLTNAHFNKGGPDATNLSNGQRQSVFAFAAVIKPRLAQFRVHTRKE